MMNHISNPFQFVLNFLVLGALAWLFYLQTNHTSLVYVDSARLLNEYLGMIDAKESFQKKTALWEANIDTLVNELRAKQLKLKVEEEHMSVNERELLKELIHTKQRQLSDYELAVQEKAKHEDLQMTAQVVEQVNGYLREYAKNKGYRIVIAATEFGNLAYAEEGLDITEEVLTGLNREYAGM